jgi:hypothetical protein
MQVVGDWCVALSPVSCLLTYHSRMMRTFALAVLLGFLCAPPAAAQGQPFYSHDAHTEYDLLDPASHQFAIVYFVTERRPGSTILLNQTRSGSAGTDVAVFDPRTGQPLKFEYMSGAELTADGTPGRFDPAEHYIRAHLPRPVADGGEGRVKILKTYLDDKTYYTDGDDIVFKRSLGIPRNAIVLPKGYNLVSSNVAAQIYALDDGRLKIAFEHDNGYAADVTIRARKRGGAVKSSLKVVDRSFDFSKTLYDLGLPETHTVKITHEYLELQPGARSRLAILGQVAIDTPRVTDVDTGKPLKVSRENGALVAILDSPIANANQSAHVRVSGVALDPAYRVDNGELAWEHTLREPRSTIVLPSGWDVTAVSSPATVSTQQDGRIAIQLFDGRPDDGAKVAIRATKR